MHTRKIALLTRYSLASNILLYNPNLSTWLVRGYGRDFCCAQKLWQSKATCSQWCLSLASQSEDTLPTAKRSMSVLKASL